MQITLTWQSIITASAVMAAGIAIAVNFAKIVRWMDRQKKQDEDIKQLKATHVSDMDSMKEEQTLIIYGLLACLKGLKEQGCNGPVTEAISRIEKHLNQKAHK